MSIYRYFDNATFRRIDNSSVIDFLSSTASILSENGILSSKEIDNIRIVLTGIQTVPEAREEPILEQLLDQQADILIILSSRFGPQGFSLNLFRHTLKNRLSETVTILREWQGLLLKKIDLHFNKQINVYFDSSFERPILFSTILVEFTELLNNSIEKLEKIIADVSMMLPSSLEGTKDKDQEIDDKIAKVLGFSAVSAQLSSAQIERKLKRDLAGVFLDIIDQVSDFSRQLSQNIFQYRVPAITMICELIDMESQKITYLNFPDTESLEIWEMRRQNILTSLAGITSLIKQLSETLMAEIGKSEKFKVAESEGFPETLKRRLVFDLISSGIPAKEANQAVIAFKQYVIKNSTTPRKILPGELTKISQYLTQKIHDLIQDLTSEDSLGKKSLTEKKSTLNRADKLKKILIALSAKSLFIAAFILPHLGCGLKTMPKNDFLDPRPDIPFSNDPPPIFENKPLEKSKLK